MQEAAQGRAQGRTQGAAASPQRRLTQKEMDDFGLAAQNRVAVGSAAELVRGIAQQRAPTLPPLEGPLRCVRASRYGHFWAFGFMRGVCH